ncbi:TPR-containing protein Mql1 [Coprinopsis cinerea okayama7|uniref:TPR-containing protein Mql1 n=1 Tax=Coprinopsis cinerea (strain Okayama-7 / 130 / ATCC MYA-4618 / FGSC 9003) TaxID=240176 RepID=A8N0U0_COPC7|nr:TPR-containing protein Mql1 [Coprinopsis cinerea okayama7\|eukprot:XP_001828491.2 TPR-containing protein Mql1 [Coprinopsis cinerea okayama7\
MSLAGLTQVAGIARIKENYPKAIEYFQRVLALQEDNGEVWSALGHCYLMQDDLQKAYSAYQQALYLLPNPKDDPKLWYGIGILYDRYGSLDHAEEAFSSVLRMDKDFDKANEILFRLGIIYKQQGKYQESLECFDRILRNPPSPLAHADIWFQIGHVFEQQKDYHRAKDAYERVVMDNPSHAKVLQQLGWLYHQDGSAFQNQDLAIQYLTKSLEADPTDAQSWYLLGRAYMAGQKYNKAYEAYQQAVYRDGRNPTFWCSIGVLYFQINQYRDALDAYSRAIRINPYISEVWFDLGSLYESCNNQITDAIDAYARASELDPTNPAITQRLQLLRQAQANGTQLPAAPGPQDVHPTAYASAVVPPPGLNGPLSLGNNHPRHGLRTESRGPGGDVLPALAASGRNSPPFRGGPPPPVVIDDRHAPSHPPLAPMEVDRPPHSRDYPPSRDPHPRGPSGHQTIIHGNGPSQAPPVGDPRNGPPHPHADPFFNRSRGPRSRSISPAPHSARPRSPGHQNFTNYPPHRQAGGPGQPGPPVQRSPRFNHILDQGRPGDREGWDHERRPPPADQREWERERDRRPRHSGEFGAPPQPMYQQSPPVPTQRAHSPPHPSPRQARYQWDQKGPGGPPVPAHHPHGASPPPPPEQRRYDRDYPVESRAYPPSPGNTRNVLRQSHPHMADPSRRSESPHPSQSADAKDRRRRARDSRDFEPPQQLPPQQLPLQPPPVPSNASTPALQDPSSRKESKRRKNGTRRGEGSETPKPEQQQQPQRSNSFKVMPGYPEGGNGAGPSSFRSMQPPYSNDSDDRNVKLMQPPYSAKGPGSPEAERDRFSSKSSYGYKNAGSPEPISNGPPSSRSVQPSPTIATPRPVVRAIDEDYDNDGIDALMGLSQAQQYRAQPGSASSAEHPAQSPTISPGSRQGDPSPRPPPSHRNSVSSTRSHASPSSQAAQLKRPRSPGSDESDSKRSRTDPVRRRSSVSAGRHTPVPSTRPSPIPFRTQPQPPPSHSPETRQAHEYPPASPTHVPSVVLPPHPRPVGSGHATTHSGPVGGNGAPLALPPIATLSPQSSTAPSPAGERDRDDRMQVDGSRSASPQNRKGPPSTESGGRPASRTPPGTKNTPSPPAVEKKEQM